MKRPTNRPASFEAELSLLASKKFDGVNLDMRSDPEMNGEQFAAEAQRLLAMNHEQLLAEVVASREKMREIGTACAIMQKWHEAMAEAYGALLSRIACCVAKDLSQLEAA